MDDHSGRRVAPSPRGHVLFGHLRSFAQDPAEFLLASASEFGDVVRLRWGWMPIYLLSKPQHIQHILQGNNRNYPNRPHWLSRRMQPLLGEGILVSEGDDWLWQRRLMQPALHHQHVARFGHVISEVTLAMLSRWGNYANAGQSFDVAVEMKRLSNHVIGRIVFGADFVEGQPVERALVLANEIAEELTVANTHNLMSFLKALGILPSDQGRRIRAELNELDTVLFRVIADRRRSGEDRGDLLSMLLRAHDKQGRYLNDTEVRDEVLSIMAGNKTSGVALTWVWYLLSQHPDVERRLHAELGAVLGGRTATVNDLWNLPYVHMVIHESLRLYPPIWMMLRTAAAADIVGGYAIPAGAAVIVSPLVTQRLPSVWVDPQTFDPERFAPEGAARQPLFSYFPFGGGPRQCIGKELALVQIQLVLALMAQRYRLSLVLNHPVALDPSISLRPRHGVHMTLNDFGKG